MGICPKCHEVIEELNMYVSKEAKYFITKESVNFDYDIDEEKIDVECPECSESLFDNEGEAQEWLKKSDELGDMVQEVVNESRNKSV